MGSCPQPVLKADARISLHLRSISNYYVVRKASAYLPVASNAQDLTVMEISGRLQGREDASKSGAMLDRESPEETLNLREVVGRFWAQKWILFSAVLVCALLAYITAELVTPIYTAKALVMIKPRQGGGSTEKASLDAAIQGGPEAVPTEAIVLQSRNLARQTIERLHLDRDPEFAPHAAEGVRPAAGDVAGAGTTTSAANPDTAVVDDFLRRLLVEVEPHSNVISVSFKSTHPAVAALVPNTLIELYSKDWLMKKTKLWCKRAIG